MGKKFTETLLLKPIGADIVEGGAEEGRVGNTHPAKNYMKTIIPSGETPYPRAQYNQRLAWQNVQRE